MPAPGEFPDRLFLVETVERGESAPELVDSGEQAEGFDHWREYVAFERAMVPASEYDALAQAFRDYVAEVEFAAPDEVGAPELAENLRDYSDEEMVFLGAALQKGSRALGSRIDPKGGAS